MPDVLALMAAVVAGVAGVVLADLLPVKIDALRMAALAVGLLVWATGLGPAAVLVAVVLVLLAPHLETHHRYGAWVAAAVSIGAARPIEAERWLGIVAVVAILAAAPWMRLARDGFGPKATALLLGWVPVAIYVAVPDTEEITVVGGALLIVVVWLALNRQEPDASAIAAFALLIVWATAQGSRGREAAVVALGCFALLLIGPLAHWAGRRVVWKSPVGAALVVIHLGGAVAVARVAGIQRELTVALWRGAGVVAAMVVTSAVLVLVSPTASTSASLETRSAKAQ